jgi:dTDP-4-dehydrorhamnose reductase
MAHAYELVPVSSRATGRGIVLNLLEPEKFDTARFEREDAILFTAAVSSPDECERNAERSMIINVRGTKQIVEAALRRGAKVVFFSSDQVYGETTRPMSEEDTPVPTNLYGRMKREVEETFWGDENFRAIRLSHVFHRRDKFTSFILDEARQGREVEVFENLSRQTVYIGDVFDGIRSLLGNWKEHSLTAINFGGEHLMTRAEFVRQAMGAAIPQLRLRVVEAPKGFFDRRPRRIEMNVARFRELLGRAACPIAQAGLTELKVHI